MKRLLLCLMLLFLSPVAWSVFEKEWDASLPSYEWKDKDEQRISEITQDYKMIEMTDPFNGVVPDPEEIRKKQIHNEKINDQVRRYLRDRYNLPACLVNSSWLLPCSDNRFRNRLLGLNDSKIIDVITRGRNTEEILLYWRNDYEPPCLFQLNGCTLSLSYDYLNDINEISMNPDDLENIQEKRKKVTETVLVNDSLCTISRREMHEDRDIEIIRLNIPNELGDELRGIFSLLDDKPKISCDVEKLDAFSVRWFWMLNMKKTATMHKPDLKHKNISLRTALSRSSDTGFTNVFFRLGYQGHMIGDFVNAELALSEEIPAQIFVLSNYMRSYVQICAQIARERAESDENLMRSFLDEKKLRYKKLLNCAKQLHDTLRVGSQK